MNLKRSNPKLTKASVFPKISIIFPVHNGGKEPLACLRSITQLDYPKKSLEVIVVDNNSSDGSADKIEKLFLKIQLIRLEQNIGFAPAINLGISRATGEYILIGNDDIVFHPQSITFLSKYLKEHPETGVAGGKIFAKSQPNKISSAGYLMNRWTGAVASSRQTEIVTHPDWIQGCALLVRRKVLDKIGLLDISFGHFFEDYDLCLRARKAGYQIAYVPTAYFWHGESTTANRNLPAKYTAWYKSKFRFMLKHLPAVNIVSIMLVQIIFITPFRAVVLRDGRLLPFVKGVLWNILHLPQTIRDRYAN